MNQDDTVDTRKHIQQHISMLSKHVFLWLNLHHTWEQM